MVWFPPKRPDSYEQMPCKRMIDWTTDGRHGGDGPEKERRAEGGGDFLWKRWLFVSAQGQQSLAFFVSPFSTSLALFSAISSLASRSSLLARRPCSIRLAQPAKACFFCFRSSVCGSSGRPADVRGPLESILGSIIARQTTQVECVLAGRSQDRAAGVRQIEEPPERERRSGPADGQAFLGPARA